jgi:hypothetical protein
MKIDCRKDEGWIPFKVGVKVGKILEQFGLGKLVLAPKVPQNQNLRDYFVTNTLSSRFVRKFCEFLSVLELFQSIFVFCQGIIFEY